MSAQDALEALRTSAHEAAQGSATAARVLIDTGMLCQALEDAAFDAEGHDELTPQSQAASDACMRAGAVFVAALRGRAVDARPLCAALGALAPFVRGDLVLRHPEGYAFYALYPELYVAAAAQLPRGPAVQVIGIRSIGSSLAGVVAAALDSPLAPRTVRPTGHPFDRELRIGPELRQVLLRDAPLRRYAVVDEGPGLSGSSFDAVATWLCRHGVMREQLVLFPSHDGAPGAKAGEERLARYRATPRAVVTFDQHFSQADLGRWCEDLTGPIDSIEDVSAGRWRALRHRDEATYPPSNQRDERRKYVLRNARGCWLLKFAGLGGSAPGIAARVRRLSDAGFIPKLLAVRHGFSLSEFHARARTAPRASVVRMLGTYLPFLADNFPAHGSQGASPDQLLAICRQNVRELMGDEHARALDRYERALPALRGSHRPVQTDSKLDACEWLLSEDGRVLKCDAEDHHAGHDLIGCQDPAWDLAGAVLELDLSAAEVASLAPLLRVDLRTLTFYELAYAAFRAGRAQMAAEAMLGWADDDAARMRREVKRYTHALAQRLKA